MNCQEFESTLNDVLDERKNPSEHPILVDHSKICDDCSELLGIYTSMGEYSQPVECFQKIERPDSPADRSRWRSAYILGATAAAILLLLGPVGGLWNPDPEVVNVAKWNESPAVAQTDTLAEETSTVSQSEPRFWSRPRLLEKIAFPEPPNLQTVGQSINSVWKSIQEDEYLLPIIRQGALIWVHST